MAWQIAHLAERDRCHETKAEVPHDAAVKRTIGAWHREWKSCGALHLLQMDDPASDGACEALVTLTGGRARLSSLLHTLCPFPRSAVTE